MILFLTVSSVVSARSRTPAPDDSIAKSLKTNDARGALRCALLDMTYRSHTIHRQNSKWFRNTVRVPQAVTFHTAT